MVINMKMKENKEILNEENVKVKIYFPELNNEELDWARESRQMHGYTTNRIWAWICLGG